MRVAFCIPYYAEGGVETTTYRLAECFRERGHAVDLLTFQHDSPYLGPDSPFDVIDLEAARTLTSLPALVRYLRRERPDLFVSVHYFTNVVSVLAKTLARVDTHLVLTERVLVSHVLTDEGPLKSRLLHALMTATYPLADSRVTVSKDAAGDLAALTRLDVDDVTAIYNPTLVEEVFEGAEEPLDHPWFGDDADEPVILGVGRLSDQKDFATLLRAFARLDVDANLVILGEGENRADLETLADELGVADRVELPGYVDNPYQYMARADVFVLSSRFEGMPNVLVEAAALGTPVVATDCPSGPRELLGPDDAGEIVPVGDPDAMADAIEYQLEHPEEARERIDRLQPTLEQFRPEVACERYLALLDS